MDALLGTVDSQTVVVIAAIVVLILVLNLLFRILKVGLGLIMSIAIIFLVLQYFLGISPAQIWAEIGQLPQDLIRLVQGLQLPEFGIIL